MELLNESDRQAIMYLAHYLNDQWRLKIFFGEFYNNFNGFIFRIV